MKHRRKIAPTHLLERKKHLISKIAIFSDIAKKFNRDFLNLLEPMEFRDGELIIKEGDTDTCFYLIEKGSIRLTLNTKPDDDVACPLEFQIGSKSEHEILGEAAFLKNRPRSCNARAIGRVKIMRLSPERFGSILLPLHSLLLYRFLMQQHRVLENLTSFSNMTTGMKSLVIDSCVLRSYAPGSTIFVQGQANDECLILMMGRVELRQRWGDDTSAKVLTVKRPFESVAENTLYGPEERNWCDAVALSHTRVMVITRVKLQELVRCQGDDASLASFQHVDDRHRGEPQTTTTTTTEEEASPSTTAARTLSTLLRHREIQMYAREWNVLAQMHLVFRPTDRTTKTMATSKRVSPPQIMYQILRAISIFRRLSSQTIYTSRNLYLQCYQRQQQQQQAKTNRDSGGLLSPEDHSVRFSQELYTIYRKFRDITSTPRHKRSSAQLDWITDFLSELEVFDEFHIAESKRASAAAVAPIVYFRRVEAQEHIVRQGEEEGRAYIIISGTVEIVGQDIGAHRVRHHDVLATLTPGACFGELSLIENMERSASAIAKTRTDLVWIDRLDFQRDVASHTVIRHAMLDRTNALRTNFPLLRDQSFKTCLRLAHLLVPKTLEKHIVLAHEGTRVDQLVLIQSGQVSVLKKVFTSTSPSTSSSVALVHLGSLGPGEYVGASMIQVQLKEHVTHMTATACTCFVVDEIKWKRFNHEIVELMKHSLAKRMEWELVQIAQLDDSNSNPHRRLYDCQSPWKHLEHQKPGASSALQRQVRHILERPERLTQNLWQELQQQTRVDIDQKRDEEEELREACPAIDQQQRSSNNTLTERVPAAGAHEDHFREEEKHKPGLSFSRFFGSFQLKPRVILSGRKHRIRPARPESTVVIIPSTVPRSTTSILITEVPDNDELDWSWMWKSSGRQESQECAQFKD